MRCRWESVEHGPKHIVPDGCVDLVAGGGEVFVAGPDTTAWTSVFPPGTHLRGLRFRPGAAAAVLGVGADELRDSRVPLAHLWNHHGATLTDEILSGRDLAEVVAAQRPATVDPVVARMLAELTVVPGAPGVPGDFAAFTQDLEAVDRCEQPGRAASAPDAGGRRGQLSARHPGSTTWGPDAVPSARERGNAGRGPDIGSRHEQSSARHPSVAWGRYGADPRGQPSAWHLGATQPEWRPSTRSRSERQSRRRFTLAVGYGPATYRRVLRLQRAIALARAAPSLAELAVAAGYADQPHLTRDCKALTGLTPSAYFTW